jgi:hypothetical protein
MPNVTFLGEIRHGEIHTEQPLADFEGEKVSVTLIAQAATSLAESSEAKDCPPPEQPFNPEEPVILEDIGRVRMPPQDVRTLKARIIDVGRLAPRVYTSDEEG